MREVELRTWQEQRMVVSSRKVRTIEEIVGECETDLSCRVVNTSRV